MHFQQEMNSNTQNLTTLQRTALNPNAKEFVPTSLRPSSNLTMVAAPQDIKLSPTPECGKASLDRTDSSSSCISDEECRRYWHSQLPDDLLTPDFDFLGQSFEEKSEPALSFSQASAFDCLNPNNDATKLTDSAIRSVQHEETTFKKRIQPSISQGAAYGFSNSDSNATRQRSDHVSEAFVREVPAKQLWEHCHTLSLGQLPSTGNWDGQLLGNGKGFNLLSELVEKRLALEEHGSIDPVSLLANEFPGFAVQSLADIYQANNGDLRLTIEMLTQLELQEDGGYRRHASSQLSYSPNLKLVDFPAFSAPEYVGGLSQFLEDIDVQQSAVVRKSDVHWGYDRNGATEFPLGLSRLPSQNLGFSSFGGDSQVSSEERLEHLPHTRRINRMPPQSWLENGDAVGSMYSELREEARDHARVRNAYFEQARQAYLIGNKALAKEASAKGQLHNRLMKAAHTKAGETIFQRNSSSAQVPSYRVGQPLLLDLHGLHVSEAIGLLKRELSALRGAARSSRQRQQVYICVGTGHHTKGSRTPVRLPLAVERYLVEDEHLQFTEPQPGMIKVVLG